MRERIRASQTYKRIARLWRWWGWIEDHVGRVVLLVAVATVSLTVGQYIWGRFVSDWPSYALYLTTIVTLGMGALVMSAVFLALRVSLVPASPVVPASAPAEARRTRIAPLTEVMSEGILWKGNEIDAAPYCPTHRTTALLFQRHADHHVEPLGIHDPISTREFGGSYGTYASGLLFCPQDGGHTMVFEQSETYGPARTRAAVLVRAELRRIMEEAEAR